MIGFVLGNIVFTYVVNGSTAEIIHLKEMIVASLALFIVPKTLEINISDLIGDTKLLPEFKNKLINNTENAIFKLNTMSETITELADVYKEVAVTTIDDKEVEVMKENKNIFIDTVFNNLEAISENILYDDITNLQTGILEELFHILNEKQEIQFTDITNVFEKRNSYILTTDDKEVKRNVEKDIWRVIKTINTSYMISKNNFVWVQKAKENKKNISNQLEGISEVITSVTEELSKKEDEKLFVRKQEMERLLKQKEIDYNDITIQLQKNKKHIIHVFLNKYEDISSELERIHKMEQTFTKVLNQEILLQKQKELEDGTSLHIYSSKDKYHLQIGVSKTTKNRSTLSGDSNLEMKLDDGKYLLAISDGMGSGPNAKRNSQIAIKMLKRLLSSGFEKDSSLKLINSTLSLNTNQEMYATLDIGILDLYIGNIEMIKNGAMSTYIKNKDNIQKIDTKSLPAGIVENMDLVIHDTDLKQGDIIIMCTDGIVESKMDDTDWLENFLKNINTENVQKIADLVLTEAIDNNYGLPKDDMTIIVGKITL